MMNIFSITGAVKALEDNQERLGFSHFNVECDTLERVFLDMCADAEGSHTYAKPTSLESLNSVNSVGKSLTNRALSHEFQTVPVHSPIQLLLDACQ